MKPDFQAVIAERGQAHHGGRGVRQPRAAEDFLKTVKAADLGLCVNISTSIDGAEQCCHAAGSAAPQRGLFPGVRGQDRTSCRAEHGADAHHHVRARDGAPPAWPGKMIDWVKEGRRTPEQAVTYMARFCSCGIYNPARARRVLESVQGKKG